MTREGLCPLSTRQIVDEFFIENRTRILELAAFLDRIDRSMDGKRGLDDFRVEALQRALVALTSDEEEKVGKIQLLFSDLSTEPKAVLDAKSASGAWNATAQTAEID